MQSNKSNSLWCFKSVSIPFLDNNQINFCLLLLLKAEKTLPKKICVNDKKKKKKIIKHSNELKNKTLNFSLIHIN
jgi:hypothetical protein